MKRSDFLRLCFAASVVPAAVKTSAAETSGPRKLVLIAGPPSHPPLMHEFRAGTILLEKRLQSVPGLVVDRHELGWVKDVATLGDADAVVCFSDGNGRHPVLAGEGRLAKMEELAGRGVGFGCMHFAVEVPKDKAGAQFRKMIGGCYEHEWSCNPIWNARFDSLPEHPITRGVKPFSITDEWYFNMRFTEGFSAEGPQEVDGVRFTPVLIATPTDDTRDGPYVYPRGPYPHIKAAKARIRQAEVAVAEAKLRLERMTIVAPVDGRVFRLIAHPGARIGSGMTQMEGHDGSTVITMYSPKMLQARVDTRFEDIPKVSLGQTVEIGNPALSTPLKGTVLFISSEADIQKNTLQVKVAIPDPPEVFKPEMLVDVTFLAPDLPNKNEEIGSTIRLYIPQQLIQSDATGSYLWIADQSEGTAIKSRITVGKTSANGLVEILTGATVSSRVISSSVEGLVDGTRIRVTGEDNTIGTETKPLQESSTLGTNRQQAGGN